MRNYKIMKNQKGGALSIIIIVLLLIIIVAGVVYFYSTRMQPKPVACSQEAKICPDGSSVGRTGSNCAFAPCPTIQATGQILGWNTYKNFGIEFQYPGSWGNPQEIINTVNQQVNFNINSSASPFSVSIQPFSNPQTGQAETIDQMMKRYLANDKYIASINDISENGIRGKEIITNSAVDGKLYFFEAIFPISSQSYVNFSGDITSISQDNFNKIVSTFKLDENSVIQKDIANNLSIYKNNGIEFEYPVKFSTTYASLNIQTSVQKTDSSRLDSNGCYPAVNGSGKPSATTLLTINNTKFCYTTSGDAGAGQLYTTYSYTTFSGGNAYIIDYVVHTSNGCGVFENSPDVNAPGNGNYKACMDFQNNISSIVIKPIQESIATFKFTN